MVATQISSSAAGSLNTVTSDFTAPTLTSSASFVAKTGNGDPLMTDEPENYTNDVAMDMETDDDGSEDEDGENRADGDETADLDWHAEEATARPEAIAERFNRDMGPMYKLRSQRKASLTDLLSLDTS